jgi:hypothetical protein
LYVLLPSPPPPRLYQCLPVPPLLCTQQARNWSMSWLSPIPIHRARHRT